MGKLWDETMSMWILFLLIPLGNPQGYTFEVVSHPVSYVECLKELHNYSNQHPTEVLACGEIE